MEGRPLDDDELIELARRGNAGAYEHLVRRYGPGTRIEQVTVDGERGTLTLRLEGAFTRNEALRIAESVR